MPGCIARILICAPRMPEVCAVKYKTRRTGIENEIAKNRINPGFNDDKIFNALDWDNDCVSIACCTHVYNRDIKCI